MKFEKEINKYIDKLINISLKDMFGNLIDFVKQYAKTEDDHIKDLGEFIGNIN